MRQFAHKAGGCWFRPMTPGRLAALRIVVGCYTLYYLFVRRSMFGKIFRTDESLFEPTGCLAFLDGPLMPIICDGVLLLTLVVNVAFMLGLAFRASGPLFAGLLLLVLTYRNCWSTILHADNLLVLHVFVLGFARSADALSLDAFARRCCARWSRRAVPAVALTTSNKNWCYGWPIQLMCAVTVLVYFLAGLAKVCGPLGWTWFNGDALRSQMAVDGLRKEVLGGGAPSVLFLLIKHVWLFTLLGILTLVVELGAPVAMFSRRIARVWAIVVFGLHWGILLTMDITFRYQLSAVAFSSFIVRDFIPDTIRHTALCGQISSMFQKSIKPFPNLTSRRRDLDST